jgi:alpha-mannosidase
MLGSQKNPNVWRKKIDETQLFYSWIMNNHWGTNYRAYQQGPVTFRYALRPHRGNSAAEKETFATGLTQPLVAVSATGTNPIADSLLQMSPAEAVVQALKPSDDGKTWISNLAEEEVTPVTGPIRIEGWQLVTVRVERGT